MGTWDRVQPLTEAELERLERLLRLARAGVLTRDELVKLERLNFRNNYAKGGKR